MGIMDLRIANILHNGGLKNKYLTQGSTRLGSASYMGYLYKQVIPPGLGAAIFVSAIVA